jgi:hypothetical protein
MCRHLNLPHACPVLAGCDSDASDRTEATLSGRRRGGTASEVEWIFTCENRSAIQTVFLFPYDPVIAIEGPECSSAARL